METQEKPKRVRRSYGIICSRFNPKLNEMEVLLVKKKNTFAYLDFVFRLPFLFPLFSPKSEEKIMHYLDRMTVDEKSDILTFDFRRMWYRVWMEDPEAEKNIDVGKHKRYFECKRIFEKNMLFDDGRKLRALIGRSQDVEGMWEFPKGQKQSPQEMELQCAIREFEEETGISNMDYTLLQDEPLVFHSISLNNKYTTTLYLAFTSKLKKRKYHINFLNPSQSNEISLVQWFPIHQVRVLDLDHLAYMAKVVNRILRKKYKIPQLMRLNLLED